MSDQIDNLEKQIDKLEKQGYRAAAFAVLFYFLAGITTLVLSVILWAEYRILSILVIVFLVIGGLLHRKSHNLEQQKDFQLELYRQEFNKKKGDKAT